jgi:hypothetical protein
METHFWSAMSQWAMYFLPSIVAWFRKRAGKEVPFSMSYFLVFNFLLAWTVVVWILLMLNAFGLNPVPWLAVQLAKVLPSSGPVNRNASQADEGTSSPVVCGQCGGTGTIPCTVCLGRGSWYTQPTGEHGVAQLDGCNYCTRSGRIRCPYCGGAHA